MVAYASPDTFPDVARAFEFAARSNGGRFYVPTESRAISWRHRAYRYRKALQIQRRDHQYDDIVMQIKQDETGRWYVSIGFYSMIEPGAYMTDSQGNNMTQLDQSRPDHISAPVAAQTLDEFAANMDSYDWEGEARKAEQALREEEYAKRVAELAKPDLMNKPPLAPG